MVPIPLPSEKHQVGHSLAEYGIVIALCVVVALGVLAFLGGNVSDLLADSSRRLGSDNALGLLEPVNSSGGNRNGGNASPYDSVPTSRVVIRLSSGNEVVLPHVPTSLSTSVATVGSNGTTELLASNLRALARQLLEKGEISQSEANYLMELADKAHDLAAHEAQIESLLDGDRNAFIAGIENFNRNPTIELYQEPQANANGLLFSLDRRTYEYLALKGQVDRQIRNPQVQDLVAELSHQINYLAAGSYAGANALMSPNSTFSRDTYNNAIAQSLRTNSISDEEIQRILQSSASSITHNDGVVLCSTGGGTDGGQDCY